MTTVCVRVCFCTVKQFLSARVCVCDLHHTTGHTHGPKRENDSMQTSTLALHKAGLLGVGQGGALNYKVRSSLWDTLEGDLKRGALQERS